MVKGIEYFEKRYYRNSLGNKSKKRSFFEKTEQQLCYTTQKYEYLCVQFRHVLNDINPEK